MFLGPTSRSGGALARALRPGRRIGAVVGPAALLLTVAALFTGAIFGPWLVVREDGSFASLLVGLPLLAICAAFASHLVPRRGCD